jgi:hypothetical protein
MDEDGVNWSGAMPGASTFALATAELNPLAALCSGPGSPALAMAAAVDAGAA